MSGNEVAGGFTKKLNEKLKGEESQQKEKGGDEESCQGSDGESVYNDIYHAINEYPNALQQQNDILIGPQVPVVNVMSIPTLLGELKGLKVGQDLDWNEEKINFSLQERGFDNYTIFQNRVAEKDIVSLDALWNVEGKDGFIVETLKHYYEEIEDQSKSEPSIIDVEKRRKYFALLDNIKKHQREQPAVKESNTWSLNHTVKYLRSVKGIADSARCLRHRYPRYYVRRVVEIMQVLQFTSRHDTQEIEQHRLTECFLCRLKIEDREMLKILLQYVETAIEKTQYYLQSFAVFDSLIFGDRLDVVMKNWNDGFQMLRSDDPIYPSILAAALKTGDPPTVCWIMKTCGSSIDFISENSMYDVLLYALHNEKTCAFILKELFDPLSPIARKSLLERERQKDVMQLAVERNSLSTVLNLCSYGAKYDNINNGSTPKDIAKKMGHTSVGKFLQNVDDVFSAAATGSYCLFRQALGELGDSYSAKLHARNREGFTAEDVLNKKITKK